MATSKEARPCWVWLELPFPSPEGRQRREAVLDRLASAGLEAGSTGSYIEVKGRKAKTRESAAGAEKGSLSPVRKRTDRRTRA